MFLCEHVAHRWGKWSEPDAESVTRTAIGFNGVKHEVQRKHQERTCKRCGLFQGRTFDV